MAPYAVQPAVSLTTRRLRIALKPQREQTTVGILAFDIDTR